jgi:hypothetical protein
LAGGSPNLKRRKPDEEDSLDRDHQSLGKVSSGGSGFLLARIPLLEETYTLAKEVNQDGNKQGRSVTRQL